MMNPYRRVAALTPVSGPDGTLSYVELMIQSSQVASTLTNFPVYVDLSDMPAAFFTNVQSDGGDIRVTESDGTTRAPVDLVSIDTGASTGELHFLASSLSSSSNTTFRIYYDAGGGLSQPGVATTYGRNAVWTSYEAVWHLEEDPSGSAPQLVDSTGNGWDASTGGSMTSGDSVTGKIGRSLDFDGSNDYAETSGDPTNGVSTLTGSLWFNVDSTSSQNYFFSDRDDFGGTDFGFFARLNTDGSIRASFHDGSSESTPSGGSTSTGTWYMMHFVHGSSVDAVYLDGSSVGTDTAVGSLRTNSENLFLATSFASGSPNRPLNGKMDEVRLSLTEKSSAWISSEYTNQNTPTTFYTLGSQTAA